MTDGPSTPPPGNPRDEKSARKRPAQRPTGIGPTKPVGVPKKGAERAHLEARRLKVEQYELAGMSVRKIAERVEVSPGTVMDDLRAIRAARRAEWGQATVEEYRDRELVRLEAQRLELADALVSIEDDDIEAMAKLHLRLLQLHDRVTRLLGLAAPTKVEVSVSSATLADKLEAYLAGHADADRTADVAG
jgi:hypothetical protein